MGVNVFYSMVREYAEGLLKVSSDGVFAPEAKLAAVLTSSHDIIAGVTGISIYNGAIDSIPAEYMVVATMSNCQQTKALQMITLSLLDFSVTVPDVSELMLVNSLDRANGNCQVFTSPSESCPLSQLLNAQPTEPETYEPVQETYEPAQETYEPAQETYEPAQEPVPEPIPEPVPEPIDAFAQAADSIFSDPSVIPNTGDGGVVPDLHEPSQDDVRSLYHHTSEQVLEALAQAEKVTIPGEEMLIPEIAPAAVEVPETAEEVAETAPEFIEEVVVAAASEDVDEFADFIGEVVIESAPEAAVEDVPEAVEEVVVEDTPEAVEEVAVEDAPEAVEEVVVEDAPEAVEEVAVEDAPEAVEETIPENTAGKAPAAPAGNANFFSGFDDEDSGDIDMSAFSGVDFLTNSAPDPEHIQASVNTPPAKEPEYSDDYSSGVDIDVTNPFYEDEDTSDSGKVAYFAELPKEGETTAPPSDGANSTAPTAPKPEELSKEELLKQAKKRKKIAKANFSFRKR